MDQVVIVDYTNHRGKRAMRRIKPVRIFWSAGNQWHPEPQWLMTAIDIDRGVTRGFALKDIHSWTPAKETTP